MVCLLLLNCTVGVLFGQSSMERMREFIRQGEIPGAVTLVADRDGVRQFEAIGYADAAGRTVMQTDSIFWIASMTKPITATAIMMLEEEGKLSADDPVWKYIPELGGLKTKDGMSATVTLRHLLTHTSGMGEATAAEARAARTLAELIPAFVNKPLGFAPGSKWQYCQSGINTLGRIVEVVSGMELEAFLRARLFGPLRMKDTTFYLSAEQMGRYVTPVASKDGKLTETAVSLLFGESPMFKGHYPAANGGLFSTAADYAQFARMILNGGTLNGRKYLTAQSVTKMTTIQTGALATGFTPGNGWGLGWCVVREPQGVTAMLSPGTFGHGGAYGTQAWIDPVKGRVYVLMVQRSNFGNSDDSVVRRGFQEAAAQ